MSSQFPRREMYDRHIADAQQPDRLLLPVSLLVVCGLVVLPYIGVSLQHVLRRLFSLFWNALVFVIPARVIFALHGPEETKAHGGDNSEEGGSSQSLHERKSLALFQILGKVLKADKEMLLRNIPFEPLFSTGASLFTAGKSERPPGLENPSNSCFQNSVLQGLASLPSFEEFLRCTTAAFDFTDSSTNGALAWLLRNLNDSQWQGRTLWTPSKLMPMNIVQQQDAQEYFSRIMESMEHELSQRLRPVLNITGSIGLESIALETKKEAVNHFLEVQESGFSPSTDHNEHTKEAADKSIEIPDVRHTTSGEEHVRTEGQSSNTLKNAIQNPVDGLLAQRLICTGCHYSEGISLVPFNTLTVPLGQGSWKSFEVFDECLYEYLKVEELDGVECAKCTLLAHQKTLKHRLQESDLQNKEVTLGELELTNDALAREDFSDRTLVKKLGLEKKNWSRTRKTKQLAIARAPKALIIHVQRSSFNVFTYRQEKNNAPVKFPVYQDMSWFTVGDSDAPSTDTSTVKESWPKDSTESMLPGDDPNFDSKQLIPSPYMLRAVVGHSGAHDYGHYVCFRKFRPKSNDENSKGADTSSRTPQLAILECANCCQPFVESSDSLPDGLKNEVEAERWWRLSDETVYEVPEERVVQQTNAFMLFYERCEPAKINGHLCQQCTDLNITVAARDDSSKGSLLQHDDQIQTESAGSDSSSRDCKVSLTTSELSDDPLMSIHQDKSTPEASTESPLLDNTTTPPRSDSSTSWSLEMGSGNLEEMPHSVTTNFHFPSSPLSITTEDQTIHEPAIPPRTPNLFAMTNGEFNIALTEAR